MEMNMKIRIMLACLVGLAGSAAAEPIPALLLTGVNNHNWQYTSRLHAETLEATGRFAVTISDDPSKTLTDKAGLGKYRLIVLDYNDYNAPKRWDAAAEEALARAVMDGTGVVAIHSANNAFKGWAEYEKMLGLMWRDGAGHGKVHDFEVVTVAPEHPIFKGLAASFTTHDELYHGLSNPQNAQYTLLAKATSHEEGGSGKDEPMAFTLTFGKGRIFATPLGHVWTGEVETKTSVTNPGFKAMLCRGAEWAATGAVTLPGAWKDVRTHNTLSEGEKQAGWELLFDGSKTTMRGFKKDAMPTEGWVMKDGELVHEKGKGGGDIVTPAEYADFEFAVDWKSTEGANSGIIYRSTEDHGYSWETGMEMQILDDARHNDGKNPLTRAGTLYALFPTAVDVARPPGEWNHARVLCRGKHIEHWLNGWKVVDVDLDSAAYKEAHDKSKFAKMADFGTRAGGHIALQEHGGDGVAFRDIKVRVLGAAEPAKPHAEGAATPAPRDEGWQQRNNAQLKALESSNPEVVFLGDSITEGWAGAGKKVWQERWGSKALNLGIGGDQTQHVLWRLRNGVLEGLKKKSPPPKVVVLMIGTNNLGSGQEPVETAAGVRRIVMDLRESLPNTKVLLLGVFPREAKPGDLRKKVEETNVLLAGMNEPGVRYLDLRSAYVGSDGTIPAEVMPDQLHLSEKGYQLWAAAMGPVLAEMLNGK
jgi:lysophospholipase L1-like esterase/type 1 glutamine amidotransferase